ncbi:tetratricopeptide repeat protein [Winogradskyella aurantia]|nr:tetratricopeptide repeat protein [Winogradskyella aurantia]
MERARSFMDIKEYEQAEEEMLKYLEAQPNDSKALELLGDAYSYQKEWDKAIEQYEILVEKVPDKANYHYKYGGALAMKAQSGSKLEALGLIGAMKRSFLNAVALDPAHIDAHWALVDLYVTLPGIVGGSFSKALKYADSLEKISEVDGYLAKGYIYEYDEEPKLAEKYYKLAIRVGGSVTCYDKLTGFYEAQNQPIEAISTLEKGQQKHQRNAMHYQIGKVCADYNIQLDKGEKCLKAYLANYAVTDGVPKEWAYYRLAQIYKHRKNKEKALEYIDKALAIRADFKQALKEKLLISKI